MTLNHSFTSLTLLLMLPFFISAVEKENLTSCLITIFVHGTLKPAEVSLSTLHNVVHSQKNLKATLYSRTLEYMRSNPYLFRNSATQGLGLAYINPIEGVCKAGSQTLRELFEIQHVFYHTPIAIRRYYTFGWDGTLSLSRRLEEARRFYKALENEVTRLRKQHLEPIIHIIGYSHGGNVALNLARIRDEQNETVSSFSIAQLILLATPIQRETDYLIAHTDFFKKVYLFYSTEDNVQTSDIFSTKKEIFSRHRFTNHSHLTIPPTLTQVRVRLTRTIKRSSFLSNPHATPEMILEEKRIQCLHMDPGHVEFWNLQWGSYWYRPNLPLSPLPVLAFVPAITHLLQEHVPDAPFVTFDYCPSVSGARIILKKMRDALAVPVLSQTIVNTMKELVAICVPSDFSFKEQQRQESLALKQAHRSLKRRANKKIRQRLATSYYNLTRKLWPHQFPQFQEIGHCHLLGTQI